MNSSQEDLFADAGKSFNQLRISEVGPGCLPEEKDSGTTSTATVYRSKRKYQQRFSQSALELEVSITEGTPRLAKYDFLVSSPENVGIQSGSLTVILPDEDDNPAPQFTAVLLKTTTIAKLPDAGDRCYSNEFTVSTHLLAGLHGEAVHQAYLFGALDGCIYSCCAGECLAFTRIACFPNAAARVLALAVLRDVGGDNDDEASSVAEILIGVSDSGWLLSLHFFVKQRHLRFFRLPWPPPPPPLPPPAAATADLSFRIAGPWLHLLCWPSGHLISLYFSLSAQSTVVRCQPSPFPKHPPRPIPPLLDTANDTSPPPALTLGLERDAAQIQQAFRWRETSIEDFTQMPDGHVGVLLKDGSTHRLADYCRHSLEKQENKLDVQGILGDHGIFGAAEYGRFLNLYESTLGYLLEGERLQFVDAEIGLSPAKAMPTGQARGELDVKIEIKLARPCDGAKSVPDLDSLTPPELLFEILSVSTRPLRPEVDPLLIRMADLFSVQIEVHDCEAGAALPKSDSEATPFVYSSAVLTQTEPWNATPPVQMKATVSERCAEFIRQIDCPVEHLLDLTKRNPGDRDQEVAVFLQLSPAPFRSHVGPTATPSDYFALRVPLRRQLLRRRIGVLDWLRPSQKICFPSDSWLSLPLRLRTAQELDVIWAVLRKDRTPPSEQEQKASFRPINICMQHHYTGTPVNFRLHSFGSLGGREECSLLLSSPCTDALWSVHSALRKRLDELSCETTDIVDIEELKDEYAALKALEGRLTGHLEDVEKFEEDACATQTLLNVFAFLRNSQIFNYSSQCQS